MPMELFQEVVDQATEMGFSTIGLTPLTGDIFMDKGIFEKMHYLDSHPKIKKYRFFTNFVIPSASQIEELFKLRKLEMMHVSLYGHDEKSFGDLTKGTAKEYHRLVRNLKHLYNLYPQNHSFRLEMNWRTVLNFTKNPSPSELQKIVEDFEKKHHLKAQNVLLFNNWGGLITNEDVKEVGLTVNEGDQVYRKGLCTLILQYSGVLADGRVGACSCRDVNGSLIVGDVKQESLSYLLSLNNPLYATILQEQMENKFRPVCQCCDFYKSLYQPLWGKHYPYYYNLDEVKKILRP
jgi:hypothetical protein